MTNPTRPYQEWMQVLDLVQQRLGEMLTRVPDEGSVGGPLTPAGPSSAQRSLQTLEDRMNRLDARLKQAERDAATTDAFLETELGVCTSWVQATQEARQKLAEWANRAV